MRCQWTICCPNVTFTQRVLLLKEALKFIVFLKAILWSIDTRMIRIRVDFLFDLIDLSLKEDNSFNYHGFTSRSFVLMGWDHTSLIRKISAAYLRTLTHLKELFLKHRSLLKCRHFTSKSTKVPTKRSHSHSMLSIPLTRSNVSLFSRDTLEACLIIGVS